MAANDPSASEPQDEAAAPAPRSELRRALRLYGGLLAVVALLCLAPSVHGLVERRIMRGTAHSAGVTDDWRLEYHDSSVSIVGKLWGNDYTATYGYTVSRGTPGEVFDHVVAALRRAAENVQVSGDRLQVSASEGDSQVVVMVSGTSPVTVVIEVLR